MSKQPSFRKLKRDVERATKVINNFNARQYRQAKNNPDADYLPPRMNLTKLWGMVNTRADFNFVMDALESFTAETAQPIRSSRGAVTTKWQYNIWKKMEEKDNRERDKLFKQIGEQEVKIAGEGQGYKRVQMGEIKENAVNRVERNFDNMSQKEFERSFFALDKRLHDTNKQEMKELWMRNYVKGLIRQGYPDDVIEMFKHIDVDDFVINLDVDETARFTFIYDPQSMEDLTAYIRETWQDYVQVEEDEDGNERYLVNNDFLDIDAISSVVEMENNDPTMMEAIAKRRSYYALDADDEKHPYAKRKYKRR